MQPRRVTAVGRGTAALAVTLVLLSPALARANGTFPAVSQLVSDPADASHLVLRSTFGLMFSLDAGTSWDWLCEDGLGYVNSLPPVALLPGGALLLGVPEGVSQGQLGGCDFGLASGISGDVADVAIERARPGSALALAVDYVAHSSRVYESNDAGRSFAPLGASIPDFVATTLDSAASDADVIYLSGLSASDGSGWLWRSSDHGQSYAAQALPHSAGDAAPFIGAVDPAHAERVYVRLAGAPGRLEVSDDGGASFLEALVLDSDLQGFALSPDGATVLVSSPGAGTYRADRDSLTFERVACTGVSCLTWNERGVFACGEQTSDQFAVGQSRDMGRSYQRLLDLGCIQPSFSCPETSVIGSSCPALWPAIEQQLAAIQGCDPSAPAPPVFDGCLSDAGSAGAAGAASSGAAGVAGGPPGGDAGAGGSAGGSLPVESRSGSGCGCGFGDTRGRGACGAIGALLLALALRRRSSRRAVQ